MNKTEVKRLLVAERKSMREKQKQSVFMRRTLSIYNGMKKRAAENKQSVDFTVDELRAWTRGVLGNMCHYCQATVLTLANFALDHDIPVSRGGMFGRANLRIVCKSCNWQKGSLTWEEFEGLVQLLKDLPTEAAADIKRRLTIGGKWGVRA